MQVLPWTDFNCWLISKRTQALCCCEGKCVLTSLKLMLKIIELATQHLNSNTMGKDRFAPFFLEQQELFQFHRELLPLAKSGWCKFQTFELQGVVPFMGCHILCPFWASISVWASDVTCISCLWSTSLIINIIPALLYTILNCAGCLPVFSVGVCFSEI